MAVMGTGVVRGKTLQHGEGRGILSQCRRKQFKDGRAKFRADGPSQVRDGGPRPNAVRGWVLEVVPLPLGSPGYYPRENVDTFYARMCILECSICMVYGDDNISVVGFVAETS